MQNRITYPGRSFIIITLYLLIVSCNATSEFEKVLTDTTGGDRWVVVDRTDTGDVVSSNRFQFLKNGSFVDNHSISAYDKGSPTEFIDGPAIDSKWMYDEDKHLLSFAHEMLFRVQKYNNDTVWLKDFYSEYKSYLVRFGTYIKGESIPKSK